MNVDEFIRHFNNSLSVIYDPNEAEAIAKQAVSNLTGIAISDLIQSSESPVSLAQLKRGEEYLMRLRNYEPLQYITGVVEFYGMELAVSKHVMIPRPETEELVEWILSFKHGQSFISILDIGTGSGCIAIALKKNIPKSSVSAIDISSEAIRVAKANSVKNNTSINFSEGNIMLSQPQGTYDLIVSNPPYISFRDRGLLAKNVFAYEPQDALFVRGKNPLIFYERILKLASARLLNKNGMIFFEINQLHGKAIAKLMTEHNYHSIELKKDLSGNDRMIKAVNK